MDMAYALSPEPGDYQDRLRVTFADPEFFTAVRGRLSAVQRVSVRDGFALVAPEAEAAARTVLDHEALTRTPAYIAEQEAGRAAEAEARAAREKQEKADKARAAKAAKAAREAKAASMKPLRGDTYPHREAIRAAGGEWNKKSSVWDVPADRHGELQALVRAGSDLRRRQEADRAAAQAARDAADAAHREADAICAAAAADAARAKAMVAAAILAEATPLAMAATEFEEYEGNIGGPYVDVMPRATVTRADGARADYTPLCTVSRRKNSARVSVAEIRIPQLPAGWSVTVTYYHCGKQRIERVTAHPAS